MIAIGAGLGLGLLFGGVSLYFYSLFSDTTIKSAIPFITPQKKVVGFLPYWLLSKAQSDYSPYLTTLTYFGLTVGTDGSIVKLMNEQEGEPGWVTLRSEKLREYLEKAKKQNLELSLLIFSGDQDDIAELISDPIPNAQNLVKDITPIMKEYGFTDLNLDIESIRESSDSARENYTTFVKEVKKGIDDNKLGTLTVEVSGSDVIKKTLLNPKDIVPLADYIIYMGYDYHYSGSSVTGAVAPLSGFGTVAEYDTEVAVRLLLSYTPESKLILGIPLYGYEWETLSSTPKSAIIPGTGLTASNTRVEEFLATCATCSAKTDKVAQESYVIYKDEETKTYHHLFFPDQNSTQAKVVFAQIQNLGGLALWALGYEGSTIMQPLKEYK